MTSLLTALSSSKQAGDVLTVTWNRWGYENCSTAPSYGSGKTVVALSGTNGVVSGTVEGLEVSALNVFNTSGYGNNATNLHFYLAQTNLPKSFFSTLEIPGVAIVNSSAAVHSPDDGIGNTRWNWTINSPFPASGATFDCFVNT